MNPAPFIDIHTHKLKPENNTISVKNLFPGQELPYFRGRNFYSVGLHPWYIKSVEENNDQLFLMEDVLEFDHVIFVGECGIEFNSGTDFSEQIRVFEAQAFMAEEYKKPLIIHCVKAYNEIIRIHNNLHPQMPWILHGYNGNLTTTKQLNSKNMLFSFGEILFNSASKAIESLKFLKIDRIFFESDESKNGINKIYEQGAFIKNMNTEDLKKMVWENFNRLENI
jgi:TatD DNase family protein